MENSTLCSILEECMTLWGKCERVHMQNVSSCMHMSEPVAYVDEAYWSSTPCAL